MFVAVVKVGTGGWGAYGPFPSRQKAEAYIAAQSPADFGDVQGHVEVVEKP